jgi:hypothetical protein
MTDRVIIGREGIKSKCQVLTEEKLDEIIARLEYSNQKSLRCLVHKPRSASFMFPVSEKSLRRTCEYELSVAVPGMCV